MEYRHAVIVFVVTKIILIFFIYLNSVVLFLSSQQVGNITKPWRNFQYNSKYTGAYFSMGNSDHIVIRGGEWSDITGVDTTWVNFSQGTYARNDNPKAWIHCLPWSYFG
jgi:hypothetical protein